MENYLALQPKIYVSYAWKDAHETGKSREQIVDDIQESLKAKGFELIRDKTGGVGYGRSITQFMQAIGKGNYIVVVLSDKSLKSEFCMYEVCEIMRDRNFIHRVFPVVLPDANIFERNSRLKYYDYWLAEESKIQAIIDRYETKDVPKGLYDDRDRIHQIRLAIDEFARQIVDLNTLSPELLHESNFQPILDLILERWKADSKSLVASPGGANSDSPDIHVKKDAETTQQNSMPIQTPIAMNYDELFELVIEDLFDYAELDIFLTRCIEERPGRPAKLRNVVSDQQNMRVVAFKLREWLRVRNKMLKFVTSLKTDFADNPNVQML